MDFYLKYFSFKGCGNKSKIKLKVYHKNKSFKFNMWLKVSPCFDCELQQSIVVDFFFLIYFILLSGVGFILIFKINCC